jgi:hypothetical protein
MKTIMVIIILLLTTIEGFSKCGSSGLYFWPSKQTISENSVFVIGGYAESQKIINGLGTTYKVYLRSDKQKIKLLVQEILVGQFRLRQAILKPETILSAGQEYELIIENLDNSENQLLRYNSTTKQAEKVKWIVLGEQDNHAPTWISKPELTNSTYEEFGCGPATFVNFRFAAHDNSEFLIKTVVKNISTGKETTYYLTTSENVIKAGHGMCSGAFYFGDGSKFEVEFSLFDASGNLTTWTGERIKFERPT